MNLSRLLRIAEVYLHPLHIDMLPDCCNLDPLSGAALSTLASDSEHPHTPTKIAI
jgi:hypothetical protein